MSPTLKSIVEKNDSWVVQTASSVDVRNISKPHAGLSNNAGPTSEKLLQFRRSFSSVVDPSRKYYVLCLRGRV
jgi:hypothetical protein